MKWRVFWNVSMTTFLKLLAGMCAIQIMKENEKRNDLHTPVPVSPLDLSSPHSGKYHGESFFCD